MLLDPGMLQDVIDGHSPARIFHKQLQGNGRHEQQHKGGKIGDVVSCPVGTIDMNDFAPLD